jgi:pimeloyl-ACP methyl ester carboxylesterase
MSNPTPSTPQTLNFFSLTPPSPTLTTETILLFHTAFSSHRDYTFITPHLLAKGYHLLLPDLPSHSRSSSASIPFSPPDTIALLADLVTREAHSAKAHIIGVSLGGFLGLYLAAQYPDVMRSVFVSGCGRDLTRRSSSGYFAAFVFAIEFPTLLLGLVWLPRVVYEALYRYLEMMVPEGLQADQRAAAGYGVGFAMVRTSLSGRTGEELLGKVRAWTLLVAARRDDDVPGTGWMGGELRSEGGGNAARLVFAGLGAIC